MRRILILALSGLAFVLLMLTSKHPIITLPCITILLISFGYWTYDLEKEIKKGE